MSAFSGQQGRKHVQWSTVEVAAEGIHEWMINYVKILAKSDALEEQRFKAYFEVNICDKEKADEFVKIFEKWMD